MIAYDMPAELTVPVDVRNLALVDRQGNDLSAAARRALPAERVSDALVGTPESQSEARTLAGDPAALAVELAGASGFEAARHIAPWSTSVDRTWYGAGGAGLAEGARLAKDGDWKGAERAWRAARKTQEGDQKGRVIYDLAVRAERRGDIQGALKLVKDARRFLANPRRADEYQVALRERRRQAATPATQVAPAPAKDGRSPEASTPSIPALSRSTLVDQASRSWTADEVYTRGSFLAREPKVRTTTFR